MPNTHRESAAAALFAAAIFAGCSSGSLTQTGTAGNGGSSAGAGGRGGAGVSGAGGAGGAIGGSGCPAASTGGAGGGLAAATGGAGGDMDMGFLALSGTSGGGPRGGAGGACTGAGCPVIVVSGQLSPSELAVDATSVYWTSGDDYRSRRPRSGAAPRSSSPRIRTARGVSSSTQPTFTGRPSPVRSRRFRSGAAPLSSSLRRRRAHSRRSPSMRPAFTGRVGRSHRRFTTATTVRS